MDYFTEFRDKTVLVTGHTGFKGSWLCVWLNELGANVVGLSIDVPSSPSNFDLCGLTDSVVDMRVDVRDANAVKDIVQAHRPDYIFHLAAQALVRPSYEFPLDTLTTNAVGTSNVLDALRELDHEVIAIMITSDKVYDNVEWDWGYREVDRLGGRDPYSASKAMAELAIRTYLHSFFKGAESNVRLGIARAGNVIGGGDWAQDRIVPDCVRAWSAGKTVDIRSPGSTRPWQHVLEPLSGYLSLAADLSHSAVNHGEAFNFGPPAEQNYSVSELINSMGMCWDDVRWNDMSLIGSRVKEAGLLKLNCDKALTRLKWLPTLEFAETVKYTSEWYMKFYLKGADNMKRFTIDQITSYVTRASEAGNHWASHD